MHLIKHIQDVNHRHDLWRRGDVLVIGVSGGRDSMCLLHAMIEIAHKEDVTLIATHINYGLRGADADADEQLVRDFCKKNDITLEIQKYDKESAGKSESDWREKRYAFFAAIKKKYSATKILVAHHRDDQAETVLLTLLRGSGLHGLRSMRYQNNGIVRPLLSVPREDLERHAKEHAVPYRDDATNKDCTFLRNRIRHELLPLLEKSYQKNIVDTLARTATTLGNDYDYMCSSVPQNFYEKIDGTFIFSLEKFDHLHVAQQRMILRHLIAALSRDSQEISFALIEEILQALRSTKGKNQEVAFADLKVVRKGDKVEFTLEKK